MRVLFGEHQRSARAQEIDDVTISFEDRLAREPFDFAGEPAGIIDRAIDFVALPLVPEDSR